MVTPLAAEKSALRKRCQARRTAIDSTFAAAASMAVARHIDNEVDISPQAVVSAYWPLAGELDPRPALLSLEQRGARLALPKVLGDGRALAFHHWQENDVLVEGPFRVMEPDPAKLTLRPTILLVPLLAFDSTCRRLGHGKGYYDRTLADLRRDNPDTLAIGVAFASQETERVPTDSFDQTLDRIITEKAIYRRTTPT